MAIAGAFWLAWSAPGAPLPRLDLAGSLFASTERLKEAVASWGMAAPAASMALMVAHSFVPFPAEMLAVVNGMVFGLVLGAFVTWAGAMMGAFLAFWLARSLGQAFVRRRVGERRWGVLAAWMEGHGVEALLLARLTPVISFNLVNYAAGLAGVGWWTFAWTTAIGILPITVMSVMVGSHMAVFGWTHWALLGAAVAALALLHWWRGRTGRRAAPGGAGPAASTAGNPPRSAPDRPTA